MRLRNVKNAKEILNNSDYYINSTKYPKGIWNNLFKNDNPIMLEIGMGKGDFLIGMAKKYPEYNFIGVEKYESVLAKAIEKLDALELDNVKVIQIDAKELDTALDHEINTIYLNFSDPWPKTRHHKRRLTHETFLQVYDKIFKSDARIVMKTDNDSLFEDSLVNLSTYGYILDEVILDLWACKKDNIRTEYEIKFGSKGFKIKYLSAHKKIDEHEKI